MPIFSEAQRNAVADSLSTYIKKSPYWEDDSLTQLVMTGFLSAAKNLMYLFYHDDPSFNWKQFMISLDPRDQEVTRKELDLLEPIMLRTLEMDSSISDEEFDRLLIEAQELLTESETHV